MVNDVRDDQFVMIRIEGMHCHKCQQAIQRVLASHAGVHEVEVDFPSGLASVLFAPQSVTVQQLMESVNNAGYRAVGFTRGQGRKT